MFIKILQIKNFKCFDNEVKGYLTCEVGRKLGDTSLKDCSEDC